MGIEKTSTIPDSEKCKLCDKNGDSLCEYCKIIVASNLISGRGYYDRHKAFSLPSIYHKNVRKAELKQDIRFFQKCLENDDESFCWVEYCKATKEAYNSVMSSALIICIATWILLMAIGVSSINSANNDLISNAWLYLSVGIFFIPFVYLPVLFRQDFYVKLAEFAQHRNSNEFKARIKSSKHALIQITDRYEEYLRENLRLGEIHDINIPETMPSRYSIFHTRVLRFNLQHPPHTLCTYCRKELDFVSTNGHYHESCVQRVITSACGNCGHPNCSGCGDEF